MQKLVLSVFVLMLGAGTAIAACPSNPPSSSKVNFHSNDQKLNAQWLQQNLAGKKVHYDGGVEQYHKNGSYIYKSDGGSFKAPAFRFYDNGARCIDYDQPRIDFYVINSGKLVLINSQGGRYEAKKIR